MPESKPERFAQLIAEHGGRMKQSRIVEETRWSAGTVSRVLSEMAADGLVEKTRVGRENVVTLVGAQPVWLDSTDDAGPSSDVTTAHESTADPILLVEDDPQAVRLIEEAFREAGVETPFHVIHDGLEALDYLLRRGRYADAPRPRLVLLDLGLLVVDGQEVLADLDERGALRTVPVVVLSQSDSPTDVRNSYAAGATAYLTKPGDFDGLVELARAIDTFWLTHVVPAPPEVELG